MTAIVPQDYYEKMEMIRKEASKYETTWTKERMAIIEKYTPKKKKKHK